MYTTVLLMALQCTAPVPAQPDDERERPPDPVLMWNEEVLEAIRAERTNPPTAARNLAMVHVAVYDAVNAVRRDYRHYLTNAVPPRGTSAEAAAAVAAHRVLFDLYPDRRERFNAVLRQSLLAIPAGRSKRQGVALGRFVAEKVLKWRRNDGSNEKVKYSPGNAPGIWQPTPRGYKPPLLPQWGYVTPFALRSASQFRPRLPPALSTAAYAEAFREVKELGGVDSRIRTAEQTEIAHFWSDDVGTNTPPGHWNHIARIAAEDRGNGLAENARLFALLNIALADAGIACWDCKFKHSCWRPVHGIRAADDDGNPATEAAPRWSPLLESPPFPAYTSGHSTFSGAAATVLATYFGTDAVRFTCTSDGLPGVKRSYAGFWAAAREAGKSRVYGGIHWEFDNAEGLALGRAIGQYVCRHFLLPTRGEVPGGATEATGRPFASADWRKSTHR